MENKDVENKTNDSIEAKINRIEEIVNEIESGNAPLEESLKSFKEAKTLIKELHERLTNIREEIKKSDN